MSPLAPRPSRTTTAAVIGSVGVTIFASLRARGIKDTVLFAALGVGLPAVAEYQAINRARLLRHHLQPQVHGVLVTIALAWYLTGYHTFAAVESLALQYGVTAQNRRWQFPLATALTATSMDLVADVALLEQGYWAWNMDGRYTPEIRGPNGKHGVPLANYGGWLVLMSLVPALFFALGGGRVALDPARARLRMREVTM